MSKVFIFNPFVCNATDGGPSGVIAQNLLGHDSEMYTLNTPHSRCIFLSDYFRKKFFLSKIHPHYHDWCIYCRRLWSKYNVSAYPVVYFHDIYSLACCFELVSTKQKVALQSHSPQLPSEELSDTPWSTDSLVVWTRFMERRAFSRADYFVFPNQYAAEIYKELLPPEARIYYLVTGVRAPGPLQRFPLDPARKYLLYIGRRNLIKGFDIVIEAFKAARRQWQELTLVIIGNGERIVDEGIIDAGFCSCPHDWINSCDYVVNCNRQSYLDLSVLETLSIGTPLIMSTTDGHRIFAENDNPGILTIGEPSVENLIKQINIVMTEKGSSNELVDSNINLYRHNFTDTLYRQQLEKICYEMLR